MHSHKPVVLFLSSDNSLRSQLAEALLRHDAGDRYEVHSAGLTPTRVNPLVHQVLDEVGIDSSGLEAKSVMQFLARTPVTHALILSEPGPGSPRIYPFAPHSVQWSYPEPNLEGITEEEALDQVRSLRDDLGDRIHGWLSEQDEGSPASSRTPESPAAHAPAVS